MQHSLRSVNARKVVHNKRGGGFSVLEQRRRGWPNEMWTAMALEPIQTAPL